MSDTNMPTDDKMAAYLRASEIVEQARKAASTTEAKLAEAQAAAIAADLRLENPEASDDAEQLLEAATAGRARFHHLATLLAIHEKRHEAAKAAHKAAWGDTLRGQHDDGVQKRTRAAAMADIARKHLADAHQLWAVGTAQIESAHASGMPRAFNGDRLAPMKRPAPVIDTLPTLAEEQALWVSV